MLVLLDENMPHPLRKRLGPHEVRTVAYQGWAGILNGALLELAEAAGFQVMVTADQSIIYQQNRVSRVLALIVLSTNQARLVLMSSRLIAEAVDDSGPGTFTYLEIGH